MVAFTSLQLLPYQVGTDRPCDAPGVWCDFVDLLDLELSNLDQILNRLEPAIPVAKIIRTETFLPATTSETVPFDTVGIDTDNMVDFDRSVFDILPRRTGTYFVTAYLEMSGGGAAGTAVDLSIGVPFNFFERSDGIRNPGSGTFYLRVATPIQWTGLNSSGNPVTNGVTLSASFDATPATIGHAELTVYWANDRVT